MIYRGHGVAYFVEALSYKLEGCGFDSRFGHWIFQLTNPSSLTMDLVLTQPLTELSTTNLPGAEGRLMHKGDNHITIYEPVV
jgi:hypothetical protein